MALADSSNNDLVERMIRVEDALAHQIELSRVAFTELHRRIDFAVDQFEKRLDQIDKRLDSLDKRFESMQQGMDKNSESVQQQMDRRFEAMQQSMDKRFEAAQQQMDRRFDALTTRMDRFMIWSFSTTVATGGIVIGVLKVWL